MNLYTRREEMRWALIAVIALIVCVPSAVVLLATAKGAIVPDPEARAASKAADARLSYAHGCSTAGEHLETEIDVFKANAKAAHLATSAEPDAGATPTRFPSPKRDKEQDKGPDAELAWASAQHPYKQAKALAPCRAMIEGTTGADATPAWDAVTSAAAMPAPPDDDKPAQIEAARKLLVLLEAAPVSKIVEAAREAENADRTAAETEHRRAETATMREPVPDGLLGRGLAMSLGVGLCFVALVLALVSLRAVSLRRMVALVPLREAAKTALPGMHAAEILRLAGQHNGGEPGIVIGAGVGGFVAALLARLDTDIFVAGVMGGLILGLAAQWAVRFATGPSRWRRRAIELGDIQKPSIPIVLVLSGVNAGLESQFLRFINGLTAIDAAATVEKLASQAEERILAAAEAGARFGQPGGMTHSGLEGPANAESAPGQHPASPTAAMPGYPVGSGGYGGPRP